MELFAVLLIGVVAYYFLRPIVQGFKEGVADTTVQIEEKPKDSQLQLALKRLSDVIERCSDEHKDAVQALTFMAASDGKVSRQELRIIIGFCERMGTNIDQQWKDACEYLNAGLKVEVTGGQDGAKAHIAAIEARPVSYRAAFLGAAEAIIACNSAGNVSKQTLLDQARALV